MKPCRVHLEHGKEWRPDTSAGMEIGAVIRGRAG